MLSKWGLNRREAKERVTSEKEKADLLSKEEEKLDLLLVRKEEEAQVRRPILGRDMLEASEASRHGKEEAARQVSCLNFTQSIRTHQQLLRKQELLQKLRVMYSFRSTA